MYILFSPSEGKCEQSPLPTYKTEEMLFPDLGAHREEVLQKYQDIINSQDNAKILKLFGLKKLEDAKAFLQELKIAPTQMAIKRYNGVAFEYLNYFNLDANAKSFLERQVIIFSNLFGPVLGSDNIPNYKLKQGEKLDDLATEKFYKEHFQTALDTFLENELIIDLRAGFYEKFYTIKKDFVTMKFIKGGKSVSHWAKAYRGKVLREIAIQQPQNKDALLALEYEGLELVDTLRYKKGEMLVYDIIA